MSLKWLRASRAKWRLRRLQAQKQINRRNRQIEAERKRLKAKGAAPAKAVKFLSDRAGWHEDAGRPNRAAWLDKWADNIGAWMRGQPWCGLTVWMAAKAAGVTLSLETVSTVAIRRMAQEASRTGKTVGGFKAWHEASATPQLGWVPVYGTASTGPVHTGMKGADDDVWEGNTSPGNSGSQNNGGGLYPRKLSDRQGWLLGWAEIDWKD